MLEYYYQQFLHTNNHPRQLKCFELFDSNRIADADRKLINFSSNDYLGLSRHPLLIARSQEYVKKWGVGVGSSRLVTGNLTIYENLELALANHLEMPSALILNSGYQANISVLEALFDATVIKKRPLVLCDRYCHNSLLIPAQQAGRLLRFKHNDLDHLKLLLQKHATSDQPIFIIVESLYSMDGDKADLKSLVEIANYYQAILYVDEAHAVGIYGKNGWGYASGLMDAHHIIMGTFSKSLGSSGAYVACSPIIREYLINRCRGLIYSTGLSPAILGAISAAVELMPELQTLRERLYEKSIILRHFMQGLELNIGASNSHIVPWIVGDANQAIKACNLLKQQGILAAAIRPPTVPGGQSRLRFCLSATHTDEDIESLMKAIKWAYAKL